MRPRRTAILDVGEDVEGSGAVTGIAWYRRDEWTPLRELATDADKLEASYEEWLADAQRTLV